MDFDNDECADVAHSTSNMPPHRKPACAHVPITYAVLLVFAVGHLLGSESPLFEPLLEASSN